jgi:hypothetical protein
VTIDSEQQLRDVTEAILKRETSSKRWASIISVAALIIAVIAVVLAFITIDTQRGPKSVGVLIDARSQPATISIDPKIPAGQISVIDSAGKTTTLDARAVLDIINGINIKK